jgi:protein SCO1/2
MRRPALHRGVRAAAVVLAALLALLWARPAHAQVSGPMPRDVGFDPHPGARVPRDVALVDEGGKAVRLGDYLDGRKPVIVVLAYYECPMLCTLVLNGLVTSLREGGLTPGTDFEVVVASIDPADTPARAAAKKATYVAHYGRPGAEAGMHFLTGGAGDVARLANAIGFKYEYDPVGKQFAHAAGIALLTGEGIISHYFYGVDFPPRDLRLGLVEAAAGTIGSARDRLMLLCFRYDPERGRYGMIAFRSMRVGGVLTLAGLGITLLALRRKNGQKQ